MKFSYSTAALLSVMADAFPSTMDPKAMARAVEILKRDDPLGLSRSQTNCGTSPCLTFDAQKQWVSDSGENAYIAPGPEDLRGPCPGLNVAANHGYLPRSGIASLEQTVAGMQAMYNIAPTLGAALAAYAIVIDGDPVAGVWSIGGPLPKDYLTGSLLGNGVGMSYAHNSYEGDASIGRNDAYMNHGDAHSLNVTKFQQVFDLGRDDDRYTFDKFRQHFKRTQEESVRVNPFFFTPIWSTVVVVPTAYNFIINLMSNHSADNTEGWLDGESFKSWFAVAGEPGNFTWQRGQERMPKNWYKRSNLFGAQNVALDLAIGYAAYPETLKIGGNVGKPDSFVGIDVGNFTGGLYNLETLLHGNNLACFGFSFAQQALPSFVKKPLQDLRPLTKILDKALKPVLGDLACPGGNGLYDQGLFNDFPGWHYQPQGPGENW